MLRIAGTLSFARWISPTGAFSIVAGTMDTSGYSGDGGAATSAQLSTLQDIELDSSNNIYISDAGNHVVREVNHATGIITTVAGTPGSSGYSGDGGAATSAVLGGPAGIALDGSNNLDIADNPINAIREVNSSTGIITTVLGNESQGYAGDGGAATQAQINTPWNSAVDSFGNLYIADSSNNVIRKVDSSGLISTVAGNHALGAGYSGDGGPATLAQLNGPAGIVVAASGDVYVAEFGNNVIRKVDSSGNISTVAGNFLLGPGYSGDGLEAIGAQLNYPNGVALDGSNNLYIADMSNCVVRKVDALSGVITTVAGGDKLRLLR